MEANLNLIESIKSYIYDHERDWIDIRRYLHQYPEISWQEFETTNYICAKAEQLGLTPHRLEKTGLYVDFILDDSKPIIIYRADIDALPITEISDKTYKSKNEGVAHSCGHDVHTTMAIGLMYVLSEFKDHLTQNIRILFQPAEEVIPSGAQSLVDSDILNNVDYILAMHSDPNIEAGKISIVDDWVTTQFINYKVELTGETGHVAHPYRTPDVIYTASQLIQQVYSHISRKTRYDQFYTMTFSMINAGQKINVIPEKLTLEGSLRISRKDKVEHIKEYVDHLLKSVAALNDVDIKIDHRYGPPPVENDPEVAMKMRDIARHVYTESEISRSSRTMGSEDFSFFLQRTKGCYFRIGVSNNDLNHSLHSNKFDIDESIIAKTLHFVSLVCFGITSSH